jgi:hypothetical protein
MIHAFILRAKAACYVGGGNKAAASRLDAHDLTFHEGALTYCDSYFGGTDFIGQEVVWQDKIAIWAMNYQGRILRDDLISAAQAGDVIKASLAAMYAEGRFLCGFHHNHGGFAYSDQSSGDWRAFTGHETIRPYSQRLDAPLAYQLNYHGGLIRP